MQLLFITSSRQFLYKNLKNLPSEDKSLLRNELHIVESISIILHEQIWKGQPLKFMTHTILDIQIDKQPQYKGVLANVDEINDDDFCFVVDMDYLNMTEAISLCVMSIMLKDGLVPPAPAYSFALDFQKKIDKYNSQIFTDIGYDYYIGEQDVTKRVCRFCGLTNSTPYNGNKHRFKQHPSAHAISWFLGNKNTWCFDECNHCNNKFGVTIEQDFNNYFSILRVLYRSKSRKNHDLDDYEGLNFNIQNRRLSFFTGPDPIYGQLTEFPIDERHTEIILIDNKETVRANMYRCLVKYVINCLPLVQLPNFQRTIEWVNGDIKGERLPRVFHNDQLSEVYDKPWLKIFIRKDEDRSFPYCIGELKFYENVMFFAIPYCQTKDDDNESLDKAMENFIRTYRADIPLKDERFDEEKKTHSCQHLVIDNTSLGLLKRGKQVTLPAV